MRSCTCSAHDRQSRRHGDVNTQRGVAANADCECRSRSLSAAHLHEVRPAQEWVAPSATSNQIFTRGLASVRPYENLRLRTMKTDAATS